MTSRKRTSLIVVLSVLALFSGCNALIAPLVYFAESIHGQVVDSHTLKPIEGAVVVAEWIPYALIFIDRAKPMVTLNAVTDAQGNYSFPSWGPRLRPLTERLTYLDPQLIVFKSGYKPRFESNERQTNTYLRRSDWNTVALELERFQGSSELRLEQLERIPMELSEGSGKLERLYSEILKERPQMEATFGAKAFFDHVDNLREKGM